MTHKNKTKIEFQIHEISKELINEYDRNGPFNTLLKIRAKQQQTNLILNFSKLKRRLISLSKGSAEPQKKQKIYLTSPETDLVHFANEMPDGVTICAHEICGKTNTTQFLFVNRINLEAELFFINCDEFTPSKNISNYKLNRAEANKNNDNQNPAFEDARTTTIDSALWIALTIEHIKASSLQEKQTVSV